MKFEMKSSCSACFEFFVTVLIPNLREYARKGYQVRIYGWLMFDGEHKEFMFDPANSNKPRVRRGTRWEIHPVTRFEVKIDGVWKIL